MARLIGIIPAKGQSSLPRKNLREVAGHSLLDWAIAAAQPVCTFVIVSSDDEEILKAVAGKFGNVYTHQRPVLLAQPTTPDLPVVQAALHWSALAEPDDVIVLLRPTSPFRKPEEIKAVADLCQPIWCDSVRSVVKSREHPAKSYRQTGVVGMANNGPQYPMLEPWSERHHRPNHPRQFLPPAWRACGFIDAVRGECVRAGSLEGDLVLGWPVPEDRAFDIDTEDDLARANVLALAHGWKPGEIN